MSQIFEILSWRDFGSLRQWSRKFSSGIFYPFLAPHGRKLRISLFDRACDQMVLMTGVRPKFIFVLFECCATRKGLKNPELMAGYFLNFHRIMTYCFSRISVIFTVLFIISIEFFPNFFRFPPKLLCDSS